MNLLPPDVLAADVLAEEIVARLHRGDSLPMPSVRERRDLLVEPRFHYPPLLPDEP